MKDEGALVVDSDSQDIRVRLTDDEAMKCLKNIVGEHGVDTCHQLAWRYHLQFAQASSAQEEVAVLKRAAALGVGVEKLSLDRPL
ncbi:hypothetical protein ACCS53_38335, partial [Rhizobium ruizarguesonis]